MTSTGSEIILYYLGKVSEYLGAGPLLEHHAELKHDKQLIAEIEEAVKGVDSFKQQFDSVYDFRLFRVLLYTLVRDLKPEVMVETGVMHGLSSKFILAALRKNKKGRLVSVDLPSYFEDGPANKDGYNYTLPKGKKSGWILNDADKKHWELVLGASTEVLPKVFEKHPQIDLFMHDSEHTYATMWQELAMGWEHLRAGGVLICDNIESNSAFFDFCRRVDRQPMLFPVPDHEAAWQVRFALIRK